MTTTSKMDMAAKIINTMDDQSFFDFSTVIKATKILGIDIHAKDHEADYDFMHGLHCISYDVITEEALEEALFCVLRVTGLGLATVPPNPHISSVEEVEALQYGETLAAVHVVLKAIDEKRLESREVTLLELALEEMDIPF